jgi:hypothetical protein
VASCIVLALLLVALLAAVVYMYLSTKRSRHGNAHDVFSSAIYADQVHVKGEAKSGDSSSSPVSSSPNNSTSGPAAAAAAAQPPLSASPDQAVRIAALPDRATTLSASALESAATPAQTRMFEAFTIDVSLEEDDGPCGSDGLRT